MERSPACEELINRCAAALEPRTNAISEQLIDRVTEEMGFDPADEELREDLIAAARGSVGLLTSMARSWSDPRIVPPPHDAVLWARSLVAREVGADALLRVYRVGQSGYNQVWITELASSGAAFDVVIESIQAISAFVFTWIDAISVPLLEAYDDEMSHRLRGVEAVRAETIGAALAGRPFDAEAASARLRYDLRRSHLGLVCWVEHDAADETRDGLEKTAEEVAALLRDRADGLLVHREGPGQVAVWLPEVALDAARMTRVTELARARQVSVAIGTPGSGVNGFRQTYETARRARRVARLLRPHASVTPFADVAMLDLVTRDVPAARELAASVLGRLADTDDRAVRALATLRIFFQEGQSYARTARRLGVHENTIADRVRRALTVTGHEPGQDLSDLRTAVELAPLLHAGNPLVDDPEVR